MPNSTYMLCLDMLSPIVDEGNKDRDETRAGSRDRSAHVGVRAHHVTAFASGLPGIGRRANGEQWRSFRQQDSGANEVRLVTGGETKTRQSL